MGPKSPLCRLLWCTFGVLLLVAVQGVYSEHEPTESECRPYIEKALKDHHVDTDESSVENDTPSIEQEENPPIDDKSDSNEATNSGEDKTGEEGDATNEENSTEDATNEAASQGEEQNKTEEEASAEDNADQSESQEAGVVETEESQENAESGEGQEEAAAGEQTDSQDGDTAEDTNQSDSKETEGEVAESIEGDTVEETGSQDTAEQVDSKEGDSTEQAGSLEGETAEQADAQEGEAAEEPESKEDTVEQTSQEGDTAEQVNSQEADQADSQSDSAEGAGSQEQTSNEQDGSQEGDTAEQGSQETADQAETTEQADSQEGDTAEEDKSVEGEQPEETSQNAESQEGDSSEAAPAESTENSGDSQAADSNEASAQDDKPSAEDTTETPESSEGSQENTSDGADATKEDTTEETKSAEVAEDTTATPPSAETEEASQEAAEASTESAQEDSAAEGSTEVQQDEPVEELTMEAIIPANLRPRDHITQILKLDEESVEKEGDLAKTIDTTLSTLKKLYDSAIKPLEILYKYRDLSNRHFGDPEIFSKPLILFMGPWSGGKSSTINYLLNLEFTELALRTGAEPSPAYFNILTYGEETEILDGTQLAADWTFSGLQKFGQGMLDRLRGVKLKNRLLEKVNIVEIPGILEIRKQVQRLFPFNDACQWFIDRADIIFLVYDPAKLDVGPETEAILDQLKGREYQTRIILNKADQVKPEELMRVQGTLIWNISPLMSSQEPPVMYTTSLWSLPYETHAPTRLLYAQERAFLRDLREAIDRRVDNKIASARRFAVRVRNHAKMVDCYLTTYYNHKTFFGNKKKISDDIIENPTKYHIYEGLSTLTNISRYDLPDPEMYRDFFRINNLYDFTKLSDTCTYFRGCPINKLDIAIAYDLPELVGKYKKAIEQAKTKS